MKFDNRVHTHPKMEEALRVPKDHVIIDKKLYIEILRLRYPPVFYLGDKVAP